MATTANETTITLETLLARGEATYDAGTNRVTVHNLFLTFRNASGSKERSLATCASNAQTVVIVPDAQIETLSVHYQSQNE